MTRRWNSLNLSLRTIAFEVAFWAALAVGAALVISAVVGIWSDSAAGL